MSNSKVVLGTLISKREQLVIEKQAAIVRFNGEISEIESAIEQLSGKKVWEFTRETQYDDEHPDYIKASPEEM